MNLRGDDDGGVAGGPSCLDNSGQKVDRFSRSRVGGLPLQRAPCRPSRLTRARASDCRSCASRVVGGCSTSAAIEVTAQLGVTPGRASFSDTVLTAAVCSAHRVFGPGRWVRRGTMRMAAIARHQAIASAGRGLVFRRSPFFDLPISATSSSPAATARAPAHGARDGAPARQFRED